MRFVQRTGELTFARVDCGGFNVLLSNFISMFSYQRFSVSIAKEQEQTVRWFGMTRDFPR